VRCRGVACYARAGIPPPVMRAQHAAPLRDRADAFVTLTGHVFDCTREVSLSYVNAYAPSPSRQGKGVRISLSPGGRGNGEGDLWIKCVGASFNAVPYRTAD